MSGFGPLMARKVTSHILLPATTALCTVVFMKFRTQKVACYVTAVQRYV